MVYGIEVAKFGQQIGIRSVWSRQKVFLNGIAIVPLECMNLPDG